MKKITIILKDITENGGGERVCANLANAFCNHYEVEILSFYKSQSTPAYKIDEKVKIQFASLYDLKHAKGLKKVFLKSIYRYFLSLKIIFGISKNQSGVILANDGYFLPFWKNKNLKYFRIWHIKAPKKKKQIFNKFDALILLSSRQLEIWQAWHKNISVIPNFLPTIPKLNSEISQKVVISVGRMDRGDPKGFFRLIEIWELVQKNSEFKGWKLHIVGDGALKNELAKSIENKNLSQSVVLKQFNPNIQEEYLQASIYAMSSPSEGFGMVLLEAGSFGIPCIAFDVNTGPSDIIENEKSGFLIKDGDLSAFSQKLQNLMKDENLRAQMGARAKKIADEKFSKDSVLQKWKGLFEE